VLTALAFGALALALLTWPLVPHDTDLWYHLGFGRRMAATHALPEGAWYSYVATPAGFVDYYWLTQWLFYGVERGLGFTGLVVLRALLFLGLAALVFGFVAHSTLSRASRAWAAAVSVLVLLVALERSATLRPHLLSYVCLAATLLLVERGGRGLYAVPPLAILWANLHGVEFPVMWLVHAGVIAETLWQRRNGAPARPAVLAASAALCVLVTPFGPRLLGVPFTSLGLAAREIFELRALSLSELTNFGVQWLVPTGPAIRAALIACAAVSSIASLVQRSIRVRHCVWLLGGAFLLLRAERFATEFALLALPAITASSALASVGLPRAGRLLRAGVLFACCALALARVAQITRSSYRYPVAEIFLPKGTAALLRAHAPRGRVLHHPNYGGFLQWALPERFQLGPDMQTPFLFPIESVLEMSSAFAEPNALRRAIETWQPEYLLLPLNRIAPLEAATGSYAPVAFDDVAVLYADRQRCADFVARFELRSLNPANLDRLLHGSLPAQRLDGANAELERLLQVDDRVALTHAAMAVVAERRGALASARAHAQRAVALAADHVEILRVAGEVSLAAGAPGDALHMFQRALAQAEPAGIPPQTRSALAFGAARALTELGDGARAYDLLLDVFRDLTGPSITTADLRLLAAAAADAGDSRSARTFGRLADLRASEPAGQARAP
jgi:tetratricopeptide (TPR) repeat protein